MPPANELSELANRACDGTLSSTERDRLELLLRESQQNRQLYRQFAQVHAHLNWRYRTGPATEGLRSSQFASKQLEESGDFDSLRPLERSAQVGPRAMSSVRFWLWISQLAVATCLAWAVYFGMFKSSSKNSAAFEDLTDNVSSPRSVATLRESTHAVWTSRGHAINVGSRIEADTLKVAAGEAELVFDSGARLVLAGPSELRIDSALSVFLKSGKIAAHMPESAIGFRVETPTSTFVDQGTEFGVVADLDGSTEMHVFKGRVDLHYDSLDSTGGSDGRLSLLSSQARRVEAKGSAGRETTFSRARFGRLAQRIAEPIQWKIKGGGNGHYYQLVVADAPVTWHEAARRSLKSYHGGWPGHLASITSVTEDQFVVKNLLVDTELRSAWMGLTDMLREGYFRWISGEEYEHSNWSQFPIQQPDNFREASWHGGEDYGIYTKSSESLDWAWNDLSNDGIYETVSAYVVEFEPPLDALSDEAMSSDLVEWKKSDGGNGNVYRLFVSFESNDWHTIRDRARNSVFQGVNGDLVSLDTPGELEFVRDQIVRVCGVPENMIGLSGNVAHQELHWNSGQRLAASVDLKMPNLPADEVYGLLRWDRDHWDLQARAAHVLPEGWFGYLVEYPLGVGNGAESDK